MKWLHEPFFIVDDNVMSDAELDVILEDIKQKKTK